jgi:hypothetical protein
MKSKAFKGSVESFICLLRENRKLGAGREKKGNELLRFFSVGMRVAG